MTAMDMTSRFGRTAAAAIGVGTLLVTVGCGAQDRGGAPVQTLAAAGQPTQPVVVSCEPHQRALVRPAVVNGAAVSQVECVSSDPAAVAAAVPAAAFAPVAQVSQPVYRPVSNRTIPVNDGLQDAQVVPAVARSAPAPRQVVYERPARRSVKKSAIIIGSSAGVGAGVGAAVGGKKGALIGAAIGGGGATVWDQITRRR